MKAAAIHMSIALADVRANIINTQHLLRKAKINQAELVVLPEFFSTGFIQSKDLLKTIQFTTNTVTTLKEWAFHYKMIIGGSYLTIEGEITYNIFCLAFPSGQIYFNKKEISTEPESSCYKEKDKNDVFQTPIGNVGITMCWEQLQNNTFIFMQNRVNFIIAASCNCNLCLNNQNGAQNTKPKQQATHNIPMHTAKLLKVPVIDISHHATIMGGNCSSHTMIGKPQIIDIDGTIIDKNSLYEKQTVLYTDIPINKRYGKKNLKDINWLMEISSEFHPTPSNLKVSQQIPYQAYVN